MMAASPALSWPDLPPELLGLVLKRLPSLADRVRVKLVCKPWCFNARVQPQAPPLPWLTLPDGTFLSIARGEIHRMPILDDARCYGSIDNWSSLCTAMASAHWRTFSKDTLELPSLSSICGREMDAYSKFMSHELFKLVVPSPLQLHSSSNSLVAIMHADSICICQPPVVTDTIMQSFPSICQLSFFDGKLYVLDLCQRLLIREIGEAVRVMEVCQRCQPTCVLCDQDLESADHLCLQCVFAQQVWHEVRSWMGGLISVPHRCISVENWWNMELDGLSTEQQQKKATLMIYTAWNIWKERNRRVFQGISATPARVLQLIKDEMALRLAACGSIESQVP